ncbi:3'-5' exonuclease [Dethiosulfatarculus sandiegensis]|uniref:DNA 3'-5' helicase n=1 Tax=Dethiosulfatarculus sandiegensis TaxID=1429043 RepID=A0A0D2HL15_9BACT|nr:3'-5' exonuclease [Dethiosulfatarculus sandiegensis]KIX11333.1 DNA helicase [Dethiosulfatarculus sandiegensis]
MQFLIADTFTESLAKLTGQEQKAAKTTAFDLQMNPANPGIKLHKLDTAKDRNFWSARVSSDIRLILHRTDSSILLCYVDHHDVAYKWAERRKLETHPKTGAAQLVEVREKVKEIIVPVYQEQEAPAPPRSPLFNGFKDEALLEYGVPEDWLDDVRLANEDTILEICDHLPAEAAEALLDLATGKTPSRQAKAIPANPFDHPDAKRRFRIMKNSDELERALAFPWERWTVFLHPEQEKLVEKDFNGPAKVAGSAGTGKTIVALHRAVHLAKTNPEARVLLTTFSNTLANALQIKLKRLIHGKPRLGERIEVHSMEAIGQRLFKLHFAPAQMASREELADLIRGAGEQVQGHNFSLHFLLTEWEQVVDAWQLQTWEEYRDVVRLGRKTRLPESQRELLWKIFSKVRQELTHNDQITPASMFAQLAAKIKKQQIHPFDYAVVDEAQDISVQQLAFLAAMGSSLPNALFFAGDLGQRIFQIPFSWKSLGVEIRGRSRTLKINYRTSHQIRMQADRLLDSEMADVDGNKEDRAGTISVFNGPKPIIKLADSLAEEIKLVKNWVGDCLAKGVEPHEIGIFVRSKNELKRAFRVAQELGAPFITLDASVKTFKGKLSIGTMHLAKGLEFRAVAVMACDDEVIPSQSRIDTISDEADLEEVYSTERHLLYVACTRARDYLLVSGVEPASEFLDDLLP